MLCAFPAQRLALVVLLTLGGRVGAYYNNHNIYQFIAGFSLKADCFDGWHLVRPFANCTEKKNPTVVLNISR